MRVNALELLRQPGATRRVDVDIDGESLDVRHGRLDGAIEVDLTLESLIDGIVVTGTVSAPWATQCRRCLDDISGVAVVAVDELYQIELTDPDAFPIENNQLDLAPMVREVALLELDGERECSEDCAGLCPQCGVNRNTTQCDCSTSVIDPRWAGLDDIVLDD